MRQIKFRVWHKRTTDNSGMPDKERMSPRVWSPSELMEAAIRTRGVMGEDNFIFLQFTGMCDKHGKEIYEGDIVQVLASNEFGSSEFKNMGVMWCNHEGNWALSKKPLEPDHEHFIMGGKVRSQEVIGNIYSNPELLK